MVVRIMRRLSLLFLVGACVVLAWALLSSGTILVPGLASIMAGQSSPDTPDGTPVTSPAYDGPRDPLPQTAIVIPTTEILVTPSPAMVILPATRNPYSISTTALEQRVHDLINQERTAQGLSALDIDPALAAVARAHSEDMAAQQYFAHVNLQGQDPTARGEAAGYSCRKTYGSYYTYGIAENLFLNNLYSSATYYSNRETEYTWNSPEEIAQTTVSGWMNSSGHRENILTPTYDRQGIGVAIGSNDRVYITEDFC
jgi:uncharacterized protein YkwD